MKWTESSLRCVRVCARALARMRTGRERRPDGGETTRRRVEKALRGGWGSRTPGRRGFLELCLRLQNVTMTTRDRFNIIKISDTLTFRYINSAAYSLMDSRLL